jgi:hypothetical protein
MNSSSRTRSGISSAGNHVVGGVGRGEERAGDEAQHPALVLVGQQQEDARAFGRGVSRRSSSSPNTGIAAKAALPVCCTKATASLKLRRSVKLKLGFSCMVRSWSGS